MFLSYSLFFFVENYREQRVYDDQMIGKLFAVKLSLLNLIKLFY
jgi:hypothetical protein